MVASCPRRKSLGGVDWEKEGVRRARGLGDREEDARPTELLIDSLED
jgi:hypothetical protein